MATIDANLNEIDAWGGETTQLPPGEYQLKVTAADVEQKEDGEKIKSQLVVNYEVISGAFSGKTIKAWFMLDFTKDTPRKRLKSLVNATGIGVSPNGSFDTAQLLACKLNADVVHESYQSKPDPITGQSVEKTAIRVVNERTLRELSGIAGGQAALAGPGKSSVSVGSNLPGLTRA